MKTINKMHTAPLPTYLPLSSMPFAPPSLSTHSPLHLTFTLPPTSSHLTLTLPPTSFSYMYIPSLQPHPPSHLTLTLPPTSSHLTLTLPPTSLSL